MDLREKIKEAINISSAENGSNTPDHILAEYLLNALDAFDQATKMRDNWYNVHLEPGKKKEFKFQSLKERIIELLEEYKEEANEEDADLAAYLKQCLGLEKDER